MIRAFNGKTANISESALINETAYIVGDVEIGENSSVWPGAVIRGDLSGAVIGSKMTIGRNTHIEDNVVVHYTSSIGNNVVIGHGCVIETESIGNNVLIGDNATVLAYGTIGSNCIIAAGSTVKEGMEIPDNSFVTGSPATIKRRVTEDQMKMLDGVLVHIARLIAAYKNQEC
ncbi:MAG: gamma carbonic anhydrase family protein [Chloroflexota bacterium]|nr:gamma carbonic anhydrase family protein [Chloroflexota bacterium]